MLGRWFGAAFQRARKASLDGHGPRPAGRSRHRKRGDAARDEGRWSDAATHYQRHLAEQPRDFGIWVQLGHVQKEAGAFDRAMAAYDAAAAIERDDADLQLSLGHLAKLRGDFAAAALAYQASATIDGNPHALAELATPEIAAHLPGADESIPDRPGPEPAVSRYENAPDHLRRWLQRAERMTSEDLASARARANQGITKLLSIVMPVYNPPAEWLREAIDSVLAQWCDAWELVCVDDGSPADHVRVILADYAARDARVRPVFLDRNRGIAGATNRGIAAATGDYIGFMDHDDMLEPEAVWRMLEAAEHGPGLIYSDEALTAPSIHEIRAIVARPAFSYDYYLSHPYFVHFIAIRRDVVAAASGYDEGMRISADVDFVLRALEHAGDVAHVPAVLYRWRTHETSAGHAEMGNVTAATLGALNRHLERTGQPAKASAGVAFNGHRIDREDDRGLTLVIIPTKNRRDLLEAAISSIHRTTDPTNVHILVIDHESTDEDLAAYLSEMNGSVDVLRYAGAFNFSRMNNLAVAHAGTSYDYLLFFNNDVDAIEAGWLEHMRGFCARKDVGAVGAILLYPNDTIQHAGVVMGLNSFVDHAHKFRPFRYSPEQRTAGYNYSLGSVREYSAVTAACMMMRREVFDEVGGFDESFEIGFNDVDLCLRVGERGYKILCDGYAVLYHHEHATRANTPDMDHPDDADRLRARWPDRLQGGDPFYNPLLSLQVPHDHDRAEPDAVHAQPRIRRVGLPQPRDQVQSK